MASIADIIKTIKEIELKPDEVELLEDCESVTNIIIGEVLELIQDPKMREDILWLQGQHKKANAQRWGNIVELTETLFKEAGGSKRVKRYHEIEAPCREVSMEEINSIDDPEIKETILKIRNINDNMLIRMTRTITKTYYK